MFRWGTAILISGTILAVATPAKAQWFSNFWDGINRDCVRNKMWPEPFLQADRRATIAPFSVMVANGVRRQNMLSDYHFNQEHPQLSLSGETKVHYILTQQPPNRRTIFVQRGATPAETAARIQMVQRAAMKMNLGGGTPDVVETDLPNDGWPADDVDAVARKFNGTRPDPRLKAVQANGDSGGGGSGNSN
jgi:hypothetical protein